MATYLDGSRLWVRSPVSGAPQSAGSCRTREDIALTKLCPSLDTRRSLFSSIRRWRYNVGQQQHGCRSSFHGAAATLEKFGPSHGFMIWCSLRRKDTLLPVHFVREGELPRASSAAAKSAEWRRHFKSKQRHMRICEAISIESPVFGLRSTPATWSCMAWAWIDRENYGVSRFASAAALGWDAKHRVREEPLLSGIQNCFHYEGIQRGVQRKESIRRICGDRWRR